MTRRLAAIMFTDLVGSTQLAQANEKGALELLKEQDRMVRPLLATHRGRLVKSTGDGMLVEFANALDAVEYAVDFQRRAHDRNAQAKALPLQVRVGIHLGDVERRGSDILGDAVNIAARVEPLADPGGVCLSAPVYDQTHNKVPYAMERLGLRNLKGVNEPMDLYRIVLPWSTGTPMAVLALGPRLAVLPLASISSDPENEYFADGLTEELITTLSQLRGLQVIARTSVAHYKTNPKPVDQLGAELGISWVLEGSVRRVKDQVRITVQLIDVASQSHAWAATYDRKLEDILAIQSDVARQIADTLEVRLGTGEEQRLGARPSVKADSYLAYLKGRSILAGGWSEGNLREATRHFELAVSIDPSNARAYSGLADVIRLRVWQRDPEVQPGWDATSRAHAKRAVELDPDLAEAHCSLATILWDDFQYPEAVIEFERALSLNPSYAQAHHLYAAVLEDQGRVDEALRELTIAEEFDPKSTSLLSHHVWLLSTLGRGRDARPLAERIGQLAPDSAMYYAALGNCYKAEGEVSKALELFDRGSTLLPVPERSSFYRVLFWAEQGRTKEARELLEDLKRQDDRSVHRPDMLALAEALMGNYDEAFRILFQALDEHETYAFQGLRLIPQLKDFRRDPRFASLQRRMNLAQPIVAPSPP